MKQKTAKRESEIRISNFTILFTPDGQTCFISRKLFRLLSIQSMLTMQFAPRRVKVQRVRAWNYFWKMKKKMFEKKMNNARGNNGTRDAAILK